MNNLGTNKIPDNPDRKTKLEQIKTLIERHNFLVDEVSLLEDSFLTKDFIIQEFKKTMKIELENIHEKLKETEKKITETEKLKKTVSSAFKQLIKKPLFEKLERRINQIDYEQHITRNELLRKIQ